MLAQAEEVEVETPSKGRRREPWQVVAVVDVPESESLRVAGHKWLSSQKILHKTQDSHQLLSQWESNLDSSVSCLPRLLLPAPLFMD